MPAIQVELTPPAALSQRVDALMQAYEVAPIPERRLAFREGLIGFMRGVFIDLHTPTQALYSRAITRMSELPLTNPGAPDPTEFELQSEVGAEISLLSSVLTGEGSILNASSPLQASAASNGVDPFNEYFIREVSADNAALQDITAADAMEAIDFAAVMMLHELGNDNKYDPAQPNGLNVNYGKINRGFGALFQRGLNGFRDKLNTRGLAGDPRNIEYTYWTGALLYLAAMIPSQKWGMVDGRYGFTFPVSKMRPDLTLRGGPKVRPYFVERSDQLVLPGAHDLDFYTWKMVQVKRDAAGNVIAGDPDLDPDETAIKSISVALDDRFLIKAQALKDRFLNYVPKDLGTHWGKYVKDVMTVEPEVVQAFGNDPGIFFQELAKKTPFVEVPKPIRMAYFLEFAKLMFEWNLPPNSEKTQIYRGSIVGGPVVGLDKLSRIKPASYSQGDVKRQLMILAESGFLDSGLPPSEQKAFLNKLSGEFYSWINSPKDATEFALQLVANFGLGVIPAAAKVLSK